MSLEFCKVIQVIIDDSLDASFLSGLYTAENDMAGEWKNGEARTIRWYGTTWIIETESSDRKTVFGRGRSLL